MIASINATCLSAASLQRIRALPAKPEAAGMGLQGAGEAGGVRVGGGMAQNHVKRLVGLQKRLDVLFAARHAAYAPPRCETAGHARERRRRRRPRRAAFPRLFGRQALLDSQTAPARRSGCRSAACTSRSPSQARRCTASRTGVRPKPKRSISAPSVMVCPDAASASQSYAPAHDRRARPAGDYFRCRLSAVRSQ